MITDWFRRIILGKKEKFEFTRYTEGMIDFSNIQDEIGMYIHIPFCKSICPYCPYNKIIYDNEKAKKYKEALIKELLLYKKYFINKRITSIYFGGGTPTLLISEIEEIISFVKKHYEFDGDIGIEIYPTEVNINLLDQLVETGINLISIGVQTFNEKRLKFLGRRYREEDIDKALSLINKYNFKCVDVDIMTNLPGQSIEEIAYDIEKAYSYSIDQLSIYPLIVFPMTNMNKEIKERGLSRFSEIEEKKILKIIDKVSQNKGYKRTSVWTYGKDEDNKYTSVTRESFIGFGAGASTHFSNYFYMNTFNVDEYINALDKGNLPINIVNIMTEREKMIFWIFWRFYEGVIDNKRFNYLFNKNLGEEFKLLFNILKIMRMTKNLGDKVVLTDWGRYAYHFVEKKYSINYLNFLWRESMEKPWIDEIKI